MDSLLESDRCTLFLHSVPMLMQKTAICDLFRNVYTLREQEASFCITLLQRNVPVTILLLPSASSSLVHFTQEGKNEKSLGECSALL